jgi:hypothetical protein
MLSFFSIPCPFPRIEGSTKIVRKEREKNENPEKEFLPRLTFLSFYIGPLTTTSACMHYIEKKAPDTN